MWENIGPNIHYNGKYRIIKRRNGWLIKENFNEIGFVNGNLSQAKRKVEEMLSTRMYKQNPLYASGYDRKKNPEMHNYRNLSMYEVFMIARDKSYEGLDVLGNNNKVYHVKINGRPKLWKTRPEDMELPIKFGMYEYSTLVYRNGELVSGPQPVEIDTMSERPLSLTGGVHSNPYSIRKFPDSSLYRVRGRDGKIHAYATPKRKAEAQVRILKQIEGNPDSNGTVVKKFVGGSTYGNSGSLHIDELRKSTTVLKTYATPLAIRNMESNIPVYYVNKDKYSRTSSRHYSILMSSIVGEKIFLVDEAKLREIMRGI